MLRRVSRVVRMLLWTSQKHRRAGRSTRGRYHCRRLDVRTAYNAPFPATPKLVMRYLGRPESKVFGPKQEAGFEHVNAPTSASLSPDRLSRAAPSVVRDIFGIKTFYASYSSSNMSIA